MPPVPFSIALSAILLVLPGPNPDPVRRPESPLMLRLAGDQRDPAAIDFDGLPRLASRHATISDARPRDGVNQHNYLVRHGERYWAMWSDGPGVEDKVGQRVSFATSPDGLHWTPPRHLTPSPPDSGPDSPHYGTRNKHGMRYISRGWWVREGRLIALVALDEADKFFGQSLQLRAFAYDPQRDEFRDSGLVYDNAINNFPPQRLPTGNWMMSRRTHDYKQRGVQFLIGGTAAIDAWRSFPVLGSSSQLAAEEPYWWVLPDQNLLALFRDNRKSGFLYRAFSVDNGVTWSQPVRTNFPDATSKFNGLRLDDGRYVLVSNPNPRRRDPLALSISHDGMVFTKMLYLVGGRRVDYPHVIQHDGELLIAFSGGKQTVEVLKIRVSDL